jgi:hypothetical protein
MNLKNGTRAIPGAKANQDQLAPELNVVLVYEDSLLRAWALQAYHQPMQTVGRQRIRSMEWSIHSLLETRNLVKSLDVAARADAIVVAAYGADELPVELCVWISAWLLCRPPAPGLLVALICPAEPRSVQESWVHRDLHAVAHRAGMDFLPGSPDEFRRQGYGWRPLSFSEEETAMPRRRPEPGPGLSGQQRSLYRREGGLAMIQSPRKPATRKDSPLPPDQPWFSAP